jgi:alkanesulfonate monooxygenase SsuD/methylene tetrahydromethanopterin reductase-like flavin-dependent oxidoreductase (luciferase family)
MDESRGRFVESAAMILTGLEQGYCEYEGQYVKQPRRDIRPKPFKSFKGRTYAAAVSPESLPAIAELGVGILIIPQKPWDSAAAELGEYRALYRRANDADAPPPIVAGWTFVDEDAGRARAMAERYIGGYYDTVMRHYELAGDHLAKTKGYEYYGKMADAVRTHGRDVVEFFMNLQVWGTPQQCLDKILDIRGRVGNDTYIGVFGYAGMPIDDAEHSMRLFATAVLPELQRLS